MTTSWASKRVLVTGSSGFLGTHVMEALRDAGCGQIYTVRKSDYDLTTESAVDRLFTDLKEKVRQPDREENNAPVDVVIHLAGLVGGIGANKAYPADYFYQNLMIGTLIMHYSWKFNVKKFVAAGAGCGYPEHAPMPLDERSFWDGFPQAESFPYSLAKRMLHVQALAYGQQHGFKGIVCVPGNIYGPYDNFDLEQGHVVPALVRKFVNAVEDKQPTVVVWGSGTPTRDFVYVRDVAEGLLRAAESYDEPQLVNLSSGVDTTIREVVDMLAEITGFTGRVEWDRGRPDGQVARRFCVAKAERDLGWRAGTSLRKGLELTVKWYRNNAENARN